MPRMCRNKVVSIQYSDPSHFGGISIPEPRPPTSLILPLLLLLPPLMFEGSSADP